MNFNELEEILKKENLKNYSFDENDMHVDFIYLIKKNDFWIVYSTDERCVKKGIKEYKDESDAVSFFLDRLRALNRYYGL